MFLFPKIRHAHDGHDETGPAGEMLGALAPARFGVVLLPREAGELPFVEHGAHEVGAERGVQFRGPFTVRGGGGGGDGLWLTKS